MKSRIISACMCKTMADLCIQSARVQHFSAFISEVVLFIKDMFGTLESVLIIED